MTATPEHETASTHPKGAPSDPAEQPSYPPPRVAPHANDRVSEGAKARIADLVDAIARFARARPYSALAGAVVAGFVVGGALSFRGGRVLLSAGARQAGQGLLKQLL